MRSKIVLLVVGFHMYLTVPTHAAATYYQITDLGDLQGGGYTSVAYGINEKGQIVGYSDVPGGTYHAVIWDASHGMQELSSHSYGVAFEINESGTAVGRWSSTHAAQWTTSGMTELGSPVGRPSSDALGINDAGYIVLNDSGGYYGVPGAAYLRSPSGVVTNIGPVLGYGRTYGEGINNSNQICGWGSGPFTQGYVDGRAFFWDPTTGMTIIDPLPGSTGTYSEAINSSGTVVGFSSDSGGVRRPFLWNLTGGLVDLGVLSETVPEGQAAGIEVVPLVVGIRLAVE